MAIDATWLAQNLGIRGSRVRLRAAPARELVDFDSEGPAGASFGPGATRPERALAYVNPAWPQQPVGRDVGELKPMSWAFSAAHADDVFAVLSHDFIAANGKTAERFDLVTLEQDLVGL